MALPGAGDEDRRDLAGPRAAVARARLRARFADGFHRPLTYVSGPPGSGKTTAIRDWLDDSHQIGDVRHVSLRRTEPRRVLEAFEARDGRRTGRSVVVLDEFEHLRDVEVTGTIVALGEQDLPSLHVVIAARRAPPATFARLRALGALTEITDDDLRFEPAEMRALMIDRGVELDEIETDTVMSATQGWATGIELVAGVLTRDHGRSVESALHRNQFVTDFLTAEVLALEPPERLELLRAVAPLDRFSGSLCDALLGREGTVGLIRDLVTTNLFVTADVDTDWYRMHPMLARVLVDDLAATDPARIRTSHGDAARWHEVHDDVLPAVQGYVRAGSYGQAFRLIDERYGRDGQGPFANVASWLDEMPDAELHRDPEQLFEYACALGGVGRLEDAVELIERARPRLDRDVPRLRARVASALAHLYAELGWPERVVVEAERVLELAAADARTDVTIARAWGVLIRARVAIGDHAGARTAYEHAPPGLPPAPLVDQVVLPAVAAKVAATDGRLCEALTLASRAIAVAEARHATEHFDLADAYVARGIVHYERNDLTAAASDLEHARDSFAVRSRPGPLASVSAHLARVRCAQNRVREAFALLDSVEPGSGRHPVGPVIRARLRETRALLMLDIGDLPGTRRCLSGIRRSDSSVLLTARLALDLGDAHAARRALRSLDPEALTLHGRIAHARLSARVHARVDERLALGALESALRMAEPEGLVRPFVGQGGELEGLLRRLAVGSPSPLLASILTAIRDAPSGRLAGDGRAVGALTARERDVLRYLASQLSYEEIAGELYVSVNTVKTHVRSAYRKLHVSSRRDAVDRARSARLL